MSEPQIHTDTGDSEVPYLSDITYQPYYTFSGKRAGWKVPDHERHQYDNRPRVSHPPKKPTPQAKPIQDLITELEAWVDITPPLETQLRSCYHLNPLRTSRAGQAVINGAEARRLTNPAGLLVKRLRDITNTNPPDFA